MAAPLVLVIYNQPLLAADHPDALSEHTVVDVANQIGEIVASADFRVATLGIERDPTVLWRELERQKPAVIVNLFEGNPDNTETESYVAGLLEWSGIPFTGSPAISLSLARNKYLTKLLLRGFGLPTADFMVVHELPVPSSTLRWPAIVKPATQDASVGLDHDSVVTNQAQLERRVTYILETYGPPVLVEEYIDGREFNVALMELPDLCCLPPAEIRFQDRGPGVWSILTYAGKWHRDTPEYDLTPGEYPAKIPASLSQELCSLAERAYRLLGLRDYARVDFRADRENRPFILEVNPNPEISDSAGFAGCLGSGGIDHRSFIIKLVERALQRSPEYSARSAT